MTRDGRLRFFFNNIVCHHLLLIKLNIAHGLLGMLVSQNKFFVYQCFKIDYEYVFRHPGNRHDKRIKYR